jgi:glycosyltransferase involved in cell wall biosynthesis
LREHVWTFATYPRDIDVAYAYGQFPLMVEGFRGAVEIPTVWQQTFAPLALDINRETWDRVIVASRMCAVEAASRIVVPSDISLEHAVRLFPHAADKLSVLPYYLPGLEPLGDDPLAAKLEDTGKLKVLFVGKEARRKGLMELVRAWGELAPETRKRMEVTVVSEFRDGPVSLPIEWHHKRFVQDIYEAMSEAHVLAFPTLRDAYGLVLVEGMARGAAMLTTSAPIQRDIVGPDGGVFSIPTDVVALARAWTVLVHDRARLAAMARANVERFRARFWHRVVGPQHMAVFEAARAGSTRLQTA